MYTKNNFDNNLIENYLHSYIDDAYKYFGSHYNKDETIFRVYAPHASKVALVGDFNNWQDSEMINIRDGIYELKVKNVHIYDSYKYKIYKDGRSFLKQDPYAFHSQTDGESASKVYDIDSFNWTDIDYINNLKNRNIYKEAINIYECHLGSWMRKDGNVIYNYHELALKLIPYLKEMGYNYIECLPLMEYPFGGSWGYQATGYFSVTSRYGNPNDFKFFVDYAHKNNIGVILDWVPGHFCKDDFALIEFDGTYLYEDPNPKRMEHKGWGARVFNFAKPEVKSFLISSANFYFDSYHIDGLRVDAVAAMLYLDYDRKDWEPNYYGGNYNLEAISFLQDLNKNIFSKHNNALMIAEESTAFPKVTGRVDEGGLGFNFKWNMGWMNDSLRYIKVDPLFKHYDHNLITNITNYAFSENYILPISHDEVVYGKGSLINKMPGSYDDKFEAVKSFLLYMYTFPGKKLLFMGSELGDFKEWNEACGLNFDLLNNTKNHEFHDYIKSLNHFYLSNSPLFELDRDEMAFKWILNDCDNNIFVYKRYNSFGDELLIFINFSGNDLTYNLNSDGEYIDVFKSNIGNILIDNKNNIKLFLARFSSIILRRK